MAKNWNPFNARVGHALPADDEGEKCSCGSPATTVYAGDRMCGGCANHRAQTDDQPRRR